MASEHTPHGNGRESGINLVLVGFVLIAGFFLLTEHRAHVLGALPFVLVVLCPLMHLFGHGGHGHGAGKGDKS